jgi:methionine biosynthesis protein MetW
MTLKSMTHKPVNAFGFTGEKTRYHTDLPDYETKPPRPYDRTGVLLDWVGTGKRVLELGCASGYMSRYMTQKRGCTVTGIEIDPDAAKEAADACSEVLVRDLSSRAWSHGLPEKTFEVVVMGDVLEHLVHPDQILNDVRRLLTDDGSIVVCLPNVLHWLTRLRMLFGRFEYQDWGTLDRTHLRFFTLTTARQLIERAGYEITNSAVAFGGPLALRAPWILNAAARISPGMVAFQVLFKARPIRSPR